MTFRPYRTNGCGSRSLGKRYGYRARLVICPFSSRQEILHLYEDQVKTLPAAASG